MSDVIFTPLLDTLRLEKISDEIYFSEKYSNYISNSRLSLINPEQDNDPKAFFEGLSKHNKYSDALIFGSAVHELCLQPELFHLVEEIERPTAKAGFIADELFKSYPKINSELLIQASDKIDYYKGKFDVDKQKTLISKCKDYWKDRLEYEKQTLTSTPIYLDSKSKERLKQCINALNQNKDIQNLLHPKGFMEDPISENEQAILLDIRVDMPNTNPFVLRLKAKLDNYIIDRENNTITVNDVKTIGKIVSEFSNNFNNFRYYRELSIYSWLLSLCAYAFYGLNNPTIKSNCLVVSTIPNYYTKVYNVTKRDFAKGWNEFVNLLKIVAKYVATEYKDFAIWM